MLRCETGKFGDISFYLVKAEDLARTNYWQLHRKIGSTYGYSSLKVAKNYVFAPGYPTLLQ